MYLEGLKDLNFAVETRSHTQICSPLFDLHFFVSVRVIKFLAKKKRKKELFIYCISSCVHYTCPSNVLLDILFRSNTLDDIHCMH